MDIVIRVIDGEVWRKLSADEAMTILGQKGAAKAPRTATKKKGRVFNKEAREAQSKRMKAFWKAKKASAKS